MNAPADARPECRMCKGSLTHQRWCPAVKNDPPAAPAQDVGELQPYIRRMVERAAGDAEHPSGMSTHDGKAKVDAAHLRYLLAHIDAIAAELTRLRAALDQARADTKSAGQATDDYRERYNKERIANDNLRKDLDAANARADALARVIIAAHEEGLPPEFYVTHMDEALTQARDIDDAAKGTT